MPVRFRASGARQVPSAIVCAIRSWLIFARPARNLHPPSASFLCRQHGTGNGANPHDSQFRTAAAETGAPVIVERELSIRAVLTGMALGVLLTPSNVYAGLKIGWSFNMSIIALLLGVGFWQGVVARAARSEPWSLHESNINQTVASAAASIISGGLVAPIPAYTLLTGNTLAAAPMMAWVFSVSFLGIWIAWYLRPSLVSDPTLTFPEGWRRWKR